MDMDINIYKGGGRLCIDTFFFCSAALIGRTARAGKRQEDPPTKRRIDKNSKNSKTHQDHRQAQH